MRREHMTASKVTRYQKSTCTRCRKAKARLQKLGIDFRPRDQDRERMNQSELDRLTGDRDYQGLRNPRNELYRVEALKLMAQHPNLIRRPLLVSGWGVILGLDERAYAN